MSVTISIITPSFNQAAFIEKCLDSIVTQTITPEQHIVLDPGSTDGTRDILRDYAKENSFVKLVLEPDSGQADAINRGFQLATGDVVTWINTDDFYANSEVFELIRRVFDENPDIDVVHGRGAFLDEAGELLREAFVAEATESEFRKRFVNSVGILQPTTFYRRSLLEKVGLLDTRFNCAFDYEFWIRFVMRGARFNFIDAEIAKASFHDAAKSTSLRSQQLHESALITKEHYGFASGEWIKRSVECDIAGKNGIFDKDEIPKKLHSAIDIVTRHRFFLANNDARARTALISGFHSNTNKYSRQLATQSGLLNCSRVIVTTFDEYYFDQGLTLIASIHREMPSDIMVLVYDLLLPAEKRIQLESLANIVVVPYPIDDVNAYPDYLAPKNYGYKCGAMWDARQYVENGGAVLWIDAGVSVVKSLEPVFEKIENEGAFFVDHDDKKGAWPFHNATFTHPLALKHMKATREEMLGLHICSCFMGYSKGGRFEKLFEDARLYARDRNVVVHDKHPIEESPDEYGVVVRERKRVLLNKWLAKPHTLKNATDIEVDEAFGYLGHRQDQSIFSLLVARYKAPVYSALKFCISDVGSSKASKLNWESRKVSTEYSVSGVIPAEALGSITYHHRGTLHSTTGLKTRRPELKAWVVLDNSSINMVDTKSIEKSGFAIAAIIAGDMPTNDVFKHVSIGIVRSENVDVSQIQQILAASKMDGGCTLVVPSSVCSQLSSTQENEKLLDHGWLRKQCSSFDGIEVDNPVEVLVTLALLGCRKLILVGQSFDFLEQERSESVRAVLKSMNVEWERCDSESFDQGVGVVQGELPAQLPQIRNEAIVAIFYPTLRTGEERSFWRGMIEKLKERGYSPIVISFLWGTRKLNVDGNCVLDCPRIYIPGAIQLGNMEDFRGFGSVEGERLRLFMQDNMRELSKESIIEMVCREAKPPLMRDGKVNKYDLRYNKYIKGVSAYIDYVLYLLESLHPEKIIVNNDTHPFHLAVRACADVFKVPCIHSERSPFANQWFERDGYYAYSNITNFLTDRKWFENKLLISSGKRIIEQLKKSPGGHRTETGKSQPNSNGAIKSSGKRILVAMDHVRATGWGINSHPLRSVNYPVFDTPSEAILSLSAHAKSIGAALVVKPHPSEPSQTEYLKLISEMSDIELFEGSIDEALSTVDVVVTFLTKVAFVAMAWGKPVVSLAPNTASASGLTFGCNSLDGVGEAIGRAIGFSYSESDFERLAAFFGMLDTEYFIANDFSNKGAKALLEKEFPESEKQQSTLMQSFWLPGIDRMAPECKPGYSSMPDLLCGPFKRSRRRKLDEVDLVHLLFDKKIIQAQSEKPIMFDVGACLGDAFKPFAQENWEVHAFEPNPPMFKRLSANKMSNVYLNNNAVTDMGGEELPFFTSEESIGISSLLAFRDTHTQSAVVETVRLDQYCANNNVSYIDFLKVDAEGFDLKVLSGLNWNDIRPAVVVCEFEDSKTLKLGYSFPDLAKFLEDKGYSIYVSEWHPVTRYGAGEHAWHGLHRWPCKLLNGDSWGNLVAVRENVVEQEVIDTVRYLLEVNQAFANPKIKKEGTEESKILFSDENVLDLGNGNYFIPGGGSWVADCNSTRVRRGTSVTGMLSLTVAKECEIQLLICRHGSTPFEGKHKKVTLSAGKSNISISVTFKNPHKGLRLQINTAEMPLSVEDMAFEYIFEERKGAEQLRLADSARPKSKFLVVLGNGPSLKGFDFQRLRSFDVIGMNAAYRYWDEIQWYPRYYICLDKVVGLSHKNEISRLIRERQQNGIEKFVLRDNLINELERIIADDPSVISFDSLVFDHEFFSPMPITTGSHAALFGAFLGYKDILILGVDCNYVEEVDGSRLQEGTKLVLEKDLEENPNYFFTGYQKAGDEYNIPNPTPDLHLDSWRAVSKALVQNGVNAVNCSEVSKVDAFRKADFAEFEDPRSVAVNGDYILGPYTREQSAHLDETDAISEFFYTKKGGCLIDVGAHHGTSVAPFMDKGWRVFAFEPDDVNRSILENRIAKHSNRENITVEPCCVSNESGQKVAFFRSKQSTGISGMTAFDQSHEKAQVVETITLKDYFSKQSMPTIDFLKIDTEGHDLFVLQGYPWEKTEPTVIECEFEDAKTMLLGYSWNDLANFLLEKGYTIYVSEWHPIIRYGIRHNWHCLKKYPCLLESKNAWGNLLAFKEDPGVFSIQTMVDDVLAIAPANQKGAGHISNTDSEETHKESSNKNAESAVQEQAPSARFYAVFGEKLKARSVTLFRVGQWLLWVLRFLKMHPILMFVFVLTIIGLVAAPLRYKELEAFSSYFFLGAVFILLFLMGLISVSFLNIKLGRLLANQEARVLAQIRTDQAQLENARRQQLEIILNRTDELERKNIASLEKALKQTNELERKNNDLQSKMNSMLGELREDVTSLVQKIDNVSEEAMTTCETVRESFENFQQKIKNMDKDLRDKIKVIHSNLSAVTKNYSFNASDYQPFRRRLKAEHVESLLVDWAPKLDIKVSKKSLSYTANRICIIEQLSRGRLATPIENIMLRALVSASVKKTEVEILEIGTLFGIGLAAIYDYCSPIYDRVKLTAIDPLDGYYEKGVLDLVTNELISVKHFYENLEKAGVEENEIQLIQKISSDKSAIQQAAMRKYDVLIIDGDHSYEGVKIDFDEYWSMVPPGGYIIMDDYGTPEWPEITEYVDKELMGRDDIELVGASFRSAVFRVL